MDNTKKDWTAEERARFERIFCAFISNSGTDKTALEHLKWTTVAIEMLDKYYKNTSHEPTN